MKKIILLVAITITSIDVFSAEAEIVQNVTCQLTKESLELIDGYTDSLGIWFQSIPEIFRLEISSERMNLKYNYGDSVGIKGQSAESYWAGVEHTIKFANYTESSRIDGSIFGRDQEASFRLTDKVAEGEYESKYRSRFTHTNDTVLQTYKIDFNRKKLIGTLKLRNKDLGEGFKKYEKYNLDFVCN